MLEFIEKTFYQMTLFINPLVTIPWILCIGFVWNRISGFLTCNIFPYGNGSICLISQDVCPCQIHMGQNVYDQNVVIQIAFGELEVNRIPKTIHDCVDFCGISATAFSRMLAGTTVQNPFYALVPCWWILQGWNQYSDFHNRHQHLRHGTE